MKQYRKKLPACMLLVLLLSFFQGRIVGFAAETEGTNDTALYVTGYKVTNETITPGTDFSLTVTVTNYGNAPSREGLLLIITNPDGVVPEYGSVTQVYMDSIEANESADFVFRYNTISTISPRYLNFNASVSSATVYNTVQLRIPVGRTTDFSTEEISVPSVFTVDKTEYISAMIENLENQGVSNVVMVARCDGEDLAAANIGMMAAGTTKTQSLRLIFNEEGEYVLDILLTYTNSQGENKEYVIYSNTVSVEAVPETQEPSKDITGGDSINQPSQDTQPTLGNNNVILICISGILLIGVCCIILLLVYKKK